MERQNLEGGWAHGEKDRPRPPWYPGTLIATTNLALLSLGAAERMKTPIVKELNYQQAVRSGLQLLRDVQGPHGGLPYGDRYYRSGYDAGRTAGTLLALAALRQTDINLFRQAATFVLRNIDMIPEGHAGPPLHVLLGDWLVIRCRRMLGSSTTIRYWIVSVNRSIRMALSAICSARGSSKRRMPRLSMDLDYRRISNRSGPPITIAHVFSATALGGRSRTREVSCSRLVARPERGGDSGGRCDERRCLAKRWNLDFCRRGFGQMLAQSSSAGEGQRSRAEDSEQ